MKSKVLVFGAAPSEHVEECIRKANVVNKKNGPFDCVILLGDVDVSKLPPCDAPLYIAKPPGNESSSDVATVITPEEPVTTSNGITIGAALDEENKCPPREVDILITQKWPRNVVKTRPTQDGSQNIKHAVLKTKPRYHLACDETEFLEREPFRWDNSERVTRFINLDRWGGNSKHVYAFAIDSVVDPTPPANATENPWSKKQAKRRRHDDDDNDDGKVGGKSKKPARREKVTPHTCFFCLSCPQLDKNLIVSIAEESYMAMAKGPLTTAQHTQGMETPAHALIIPIAHVPTFAALPEESRVAVELERRKYLVALGELYHTYKMHPVAFEISRSRGVHVHTQVVPVPQKIGVDAIEQAFRAGAAQSDIVLHKRALDADETEFFKVVLPDQTTLVVELGKDTKSFDLQFGRRVLAKLLGIPERTDWRACEQPAQQEAKDAAQFKQMFQPVDFTV